MRTQRCIKTYFTLIMKYFGYLYIFSHTGFGFPVIPSVIIVISLNIFRTNQKDLLKFCICIDSDKNSVEIVAYYFPTFVTELYPLIYV